VPPISLIDCLPSSSRIQRRSGSRLIALSVCLCATLLAHSQDNFRAAGLSAIDTKAVFAANRPIPSVKRPVASEILFEGLGSYGHYKPFGGATGASLFTAGVEYDRSLGHFLGTRLDYAGEFLPVVLLKQAKTATDDGVPTTSAREVVRGVAIAPVGFRILWRENRKWEPYFLGKFGMVGFTQKALSQHATYENFYVQSGMGVQLRMSERLGLRLGLFSFTHISNANMVPVNPGLDLMTTTLGLSYHLGRPRIPVE
jgi:hypothetical protein